MTRASPNIGVQYGRAARQVIRHPQIYLREWDEPRVSGGRRPDLFIGRDATGRMLEVMLVDIGRQGILMVFHVMPLRAKTLERAEQVIAARKERRR